MQALEVSETRLMNFRVSDEVRSSFGTICRYNGSNMTNELIRLMRTYIAREGTKILQEQHNGDQVSKLIPRHSKTARKSMVVDDWYDDTENHNMSGERRGDWILDDDKTWRQKG